ncbi:MAG TPA: dipeptide epimerase [Steroidobacteraceae bacterium]|nr:dipeptide epimerase [Steroidobacteraceae bacterium]
MSPNTTRSGRLALRLAIERFPLKEPFHITGHTMVDAEVLSVEIEADGRVGRGESSGVYYRQADNAPANLKQIEALRARVEAGIDRRSLQTLLPPGGARNALDCALWDLEAKTTGQPAWQLAGLAPPQPLLTTFTVGANDARKMAADACAYTHAKAIKLKLTGEAADAARVRAVRAARPDVWLGVDANQGFTRETLDALLPTLVDADVRLIEQPFRIGQEALLDGLESPIPIAADESVQCLADVPKLRGRFQVMNIKLDKCGGLTEALEMAREAARCGLDVMVGNMVGTSLAMAPAFLVGQLCKVVDLDGPVFLSRDRTPAVRYENGTISCPPALWGAPTAA